MAILAIAVELHSAFGAVKILETLHSARGEREEARKDSIAGGQNPSLLSDVDMWMVQNAPRSRDPIIVPAPVYSFSATMPANAEWR